MKKTIVVLFMLFVGSLLVFVISQNNISSQNHSHSNNSTQNNIVENQTTYDFVYPKKVTQKREIIWKFISNDVWSVYSRRDAIVKDILVDIWDTVKAWQVLATLFDVWVAGEAASNITEKSEMLKSSQIALQNAISIKNQKINELQERINEQYKLLELAGKNKEVRIVQIQNLLDNTSLIEENSILLRKQSVEVEQKSLTLLEKNLEDAISSKESKLKELENKKTQISDASLIVIDKSFDEIIKLIYLWQERVFLNNSFINNNDISPYLSAKNASLRNTFLQKVQNFQNLRVKSPDIMKLFREWEEMYSLAPSVIDNTILSVDISQNLLDSLRNSILTANMNLIKQKADFENIETNYETTLRVETEKINAIQNNIAKQKELVVLRQKELEVALNTQNKTNTNLEDELKKIQTSEWTTIETIQARISVLEENLSLLKIQEQANIDSIQNAVNIAKSSLGTTLTTYGSNQILSPFDGVISKRNISVWDMISSSMLAFEMTWVPTTLSKNAAQEVVFSIPQELKNYAQNWLEVSFVWVEDSTNIFTGTIWRISPQIDTINNTIQLQARVSDPFLPHNSNVRVFLDMKKNYFQVPFKSIYNRNWEKVVYFLRESWNLGYRKVNIINEIWEMVDIEGFDFDESYKIITTPLYFDN